MDEIMNLEELKKMVLEFMNTTNDSVETLSKHVAMLENSIETNSGNIFTNIARADAIEKRINAQHELITTLTDRAEMNSNIKCPNCNELLCYKEQQRILQCRNCVKTYEMIEVKSIRELKKFFNPQDPTVEWDWELTCRFEKGCKEHLIKQLKAEFVALFDEKSINFIRWDLCQDCFNFRTEDVLGYRDEFLGWCATDFDKAKSTPATNCIIYKILKLYEKYSSEETEK